MPPRVEVAGGSFMPQEIAIRTGGIIPVIGLAAFFPQGEGYCRFGAALLQAGDYVFQQFVGVIGVLAALQDKGAKAQPVTPLAQMPDLFRRSR